MNDPNLTNILISITGSLIIAVLGWLTASHRAYRKDQASLRTEMRAEFASANAAADARADELSRRIDNNGHRIDNSTASADARADELSRRIDNSTASADARADELSRRIDNNEARAAARADELSRRIEDNGRRIDDNGRQLNQLVSWMAALVERLTRLEVRVDPQAPPPSLEGFPMTNPPPPAEQLPSAQTM